MTVHVKFASMLCDEEAKVEINTLEEFSELYDTLEKSSQIAPTYFGFSGLVLTKDENKEFHIVVYDDYIE